MDTQPNQAFPAIPLGKQRDVKKAKAVGHPDLSGAYPLDVI
ncbi:MAG: hypothetical protein NTX44_13910 [Ignavibacteriales bacterium]|nr:hypothetical protein [Ignavibacteriales bacterium]